jgi:hypothetical protein
MKTYIPQEHYYWIADALGMHLEVGAKRLSGSGRLAIPMVPTMRLVCPMRIVSSMHRSKMNQSAVCVHIRYDLYVLLCFNGLSSTSFCTVVDAKEVDFKMQTVFSGVRSFREALKRCEPGRKRTWACEAEGKWRKLNGANSVG